MRTAQVGGASLLALALLSRVLPSGQFRRIVRGTGGVVTAGLSAYLAATFNARTRFPGIPLLTHLPPETGRAVALTFDDGPDPETTPYLLDTLAAFGARATFFVVGERAAAHPALVRRIVAEGHAVGVHGLHHRTMVLQSAQQITTDLHKATGHIEAALGTPLPSRLLRPPYGFKTWTLARTAHRRGWTFVAWSLDPRDYDPRTPEQLLSALRTQLRAGDIVLLHERPGDRRTRKILPALLRHCGEQGLSCIPLPPPRS